MDTNSNIQSNIQYKRVSRILAVFIVASGIILGIYNIFFSDSYYILLAFAFCLFPLIPPLLDRLLKIRPVYVIHFTLLLFLILSYGIGMVLNGYHRIPYFDKLMHLLSGIVFTVVGSCLFYVFKTELTIEPGDAALNCFFSFDFSLAVAAIWEILEYVIDLILHNDPQNVLTTGVHDTMQDIIACLAGTLVVVLYLYLYYKKNRHSLFSRIIENFHSINL